MSENEWQELSKAISGAMIKNKEVLKKFAAIQGNPALYGAENGFTTEDLKILEGFIDFCGEAAFAAKEISERASAPKKPSDPRDKK